MFLQNIKFKLIVALHLIIFENNHYLSYIRPHDEGRAIADTHAWSRSNSFEIWMEKNWNFWIWRVPVLIGPLRLPINRWGGDPSLIAQNITTYMMFLWKQVNEI